MTVSNQKRAIATRGTKHKATTLAANDVCHVPAKKTDCSPYDNFIYTEGKLHLGTNSQQTFINRCRVWIDGGCVGVPGGTDSLPAHPPHTMGLFTTKIYKKEAWNTSCSDDLFVEGKGVVRTDDTTRQNEKNIWGKVDGSELTPGRDPTEDMFLNACKIKTLTGKSTGAEGAPLEKKAPNAQKKDYLHVYEGDTVELEVYRIDTTSGSEAKAGTCKLTPKHTIWKARRTGGGFDPKDKEGSGDKFTFGNDLTDLGMDLPLGATKVGLNDEAAGAKVGWEVDWDQLVKIWRIEKSPAEISVEAIACGGTQTANIVIKPKGKVKFAFAFENEPPEGEGNERKIGHNNTFRSLLLCAALMKVPLKVLSAAAAIGDNVVFNYRFLEGMAFELEIEYVRCSKSSNRRGVTFTPAYLRPTWTFSIEANPFIELSLQGIIALVDVAKVYAPGIGNAVAKLLKKIKASLAKVTLGVTLNCAVGGKFGIDEHNELTNTSRFIYAKFTLTFFLELKVEISVAEAWIKGSVTGELEIGLGPPQQADSILAFCYDGILKTNLELGGKIWIFESSQVFDGPKVDPPGGVRHIPSPI